ncbi:MULTISPECIES: FAD-binding and (Fe-S)-binding domain-containing protein [unclassified Sulfurospirillum]|uniref:FAD-binding and (Fe-S)-binding domain-containing protein n=1 Tax=unclassified Sulfurospirillum TaxID=2618290 RepID=UPI00050282D8|nr:MULTISPECIES: FAD-binding and (Fe-S)-binding domain-containing protein [unclassified Sulfurospirillum]KFL34358.1 4Fe-4S ferredoxin [Sulfurospirillum sp. SCADC]
MLLSGKYLDFYNEIIAFIPEKRIFTDPLHTIAYGTDASFYRLVPKVVVWANNADEVSQILKITSSLSLPVVFRAAGTSLSGQAITDSILLMTSRDWKKINVNKEVSTITMQPSVIGADANAYLLPYGKKIGPDPASISSAMIAGIAANNASGMCCGTTDNSYKTLESMKIIFHDGTELDTASPQSIKEFKQYHHALVERISALSAEIKANPSLHDKIVRKFKIKNTCGYSLNALVDYEDPIDIIAHLMIGSEGTLGFIKEITFKTVPEYKDKASALMIFKNIKDACDAVIVLKTQCKENVAAAEMMDRAGLASVENKEGMPSFLKTLSPTATALLVESRAENDAKLDENIAVILEKLSHFEPEMPLHFTKDVYEYTKYWKIRKGLFPAVGAVRESGTTVIIEDVAYPIESLADATLELQDLFKKYGYNEAIIFGHALDGNLHFVFTQAFEDPKEIQRYEAFMQDVAEQVATKYHGSLKAEHGTGRNMAPFVELEWGNDAYMLMKEIKNIFDPRGLLNPGVIINDDPKAHLKNFKSMPVTDEYIDKCIECGFCEPACPSNFLTLTPRQRIVSNRYMSTLKNAGDEEALEAFQALYQYDGVDTCATCSLCSLVCPVGIDTGALTKKIRAHQITPTQHKIASMIANNYGTILGVGSFVLSAVKGVNAVIPDGVMKAMSAGVTALSGNKLPLWTTSLPGGHTFKDSRKLFGVADKVVYFSSCLNRTMGNPKPKGEEKELDELIIGILEKAGFEVIFPEQLKPLCCGMPFSSKGYKKEGKQKSVELEAALNKASENGKYPILCDMSSCTKTMMEYFDSGLKVHDPIEFIHDFLLDKLTIKQIDEPVVIHTICSTRKMGLADKFEKIARLCSSKVTVPADVTCCGFAGDRGFNYPELNKSALRHLKASIPSDTKLAFSTGKPCEIGLSEESGLEYRSLFYLLERAIS